MPAPPDGLGLVLHRGEGIALLRQHLLMMPSTLPRLGRVVEGVDLQSRSSFFLSSSSMFVVVRALLPR